MKLKELKNTNQVIKFAACSYCSAYLSYAGPAISVSIICLCLPTCLWTNNKSTGKFLTNWFILVVFPKVNSYGHPPGITQQAFLTCDTY